MKWSSILWTQKFKHPLLPTHGWLVDLPRQKKLQDLLPGIINQLGPDNLINLKKIAQQFQKQESGAPEEEDDDDVPDLVEGETFEEAAKDEPSS